MSLIIVVDDDMTNLKTAGYILSKQGLRVGALKSGQAMLDYLKKNPSPYPDLILLDINMPDMDGFETLERLRRQEQETGMPGIPVIFLSADLRPEAEARGRELGAGDFIRKPFDPDVLIGRVREALHSRKEGKTSGAFSLDAFTKVLERRNAATSPIWMGEEAFSSIYNYMIHYLERYHGLAFRVLFTVTVDEQITDPQEQAEILQYFRNLIQDSLRSSDLMVEVSPNQIFLLLPQSQENGIEAAIRRLLGRWEDSEYHDKAAVSWETGKVDLEEREDARPEKKEDWVVVVDDDSTNLMIAEKILSREQIRVSTLGSGSELLEFVKSNQPDLILLDIKMPGMDGFETLRRLKAGPRETRDIPVIFVTADEAQESETAGLELGAEDFLKKPFVPDILKIRVRHTIDRIRLQRNLAYEVTLKTEENQKLFLHVVRALAASIDAKDTYTNGHSDRVAAYARQIAQRYGYSLDQLDEIYMLGILHDVGKIGIPDAIINKPARLTDEEYDIIKTHTVMGAKILGNIAEMPALITGARWHHERFDGRGYPDGLSGTDIPEAARIIAVADAYDAMSSRRSYRDVLPQATARAELEKGKSTQFDPRFAEIMIGMIDEDPDYTMREH